MNRSTRCLATAVAAWLLAAPAAAAEIYKWVDESGVTHYSQQPPPEGARTIIETRPAPPSAVDQQKAADTTGSSDAGASDGEQETIEDYCEELRGRIEMLESDQPLRMKNEDGTLKPLSGDARAQQLQQARGQLTQHCD